VKLLSHKSEWLKLLVTSKHSERKWLESLKDTFRMLCMYYLFCQHCVKIFHRNYWWKALQQFIYLLVCFPCNLLDIVLFRFSCSSAWKMKCFKFHVKTEICWFWLYLESSERAAVYFCSDLWTSISSWISISMMQISQ